MPNQHSFRYPDDKWEQFCKKAKRMGFASANQRLYYLMNEDLESQTLEELEERIAASMGRLDARVKNNASVAQLSFTAVWKLAELIINSQSAAPAEAEARFEQFKRSVSQDYEKKGALKDMLDAITTER